ncbi:uncharacterized protein LOC120453254 [Drosophila santomea]|uniref:uncharacterized protein LOC120453254 n=1 Tax=Drosophila santomea TaxID=129105 RepID=UPI0019546318|nr:uncharacterized protein LOC120453254 [Drosophila santomea]
MSIEKHTLKIPKRTSPTPKRHKIFQAVLQLRSGKKGKDGSRPSHMDGGGDNQLAVRSLAGRQREAFSHHAAPPTAILQVPDPGQGDAVDLRMAVQAFILAELAEDSGFESGSEGD